MPSSKPFGASPVVPKLRGPNNNSNSNSDNSDYGELRAIVKRIEMNHHESTLTPGVHKKKLVFDYVPASVIMKNQIGDYRPQYVQHSNHGHQQQYPASGSLQQPRARLEPAPAAASTAGPSLLANHSVKQIWQGTVQPNDQGSQTSERSSEAAKLNDMRVHATNPVTIKGWLYKRGNDGLKLWKKRYFVLADYCLSYYRNPHDEKASGSVMLPSYRISPVSKDDGIPRKFAFKAEHQNMRTYYFASDSQANMVQWMNAMSLAAILQADKSFARPKKMLNNNSTFAGAYRTNSKLYEATTNASPNFHNYPPAVHTMQSIHGQAYAFPPAPVYVNAPPKPQRVSTTQNPLMVTGQYHQPLSSGDVQHAHQRWIPGPVAGGTLNHPHQLPPPRRQAAPKDLSRSLGRAAGAQLMHDAYGAGSVGRYGGAMMAPRTPMMGRQIKVRRQLQQQQFNQQPARPKSSIEPRDESWNHNEPQIDSYRRDPRLFPIRTPQPPPKRAQNGLYNSQYFVDNEVSQFFEAGDFHRSASARLRSKTPMANNNSHGKHSLDESYQRAQQQGQRDESMKRLLEWKQRMLQSPLTKKGSRAVTPVGSNEIPLNHATTGQLCLQTGKLSRKGSNVSRVSRTRSLSRLSNRPSSSSSSDEGKRYSLAKTILNALINGATLSVAQIMTLAKLLVSICASQTA